MRLLITWFLLLISTAAFAEDFGATTTAFLDQGALPVLYTCDGKDVSPQLTWTNPPAKTQAFAIIVSDPEATSGTFYHWLVYNIPASVSTIDEGAKTIPGGGLVGKNDFGKAQYNGPCPPKGAAHTYEFTLYALNGKLSLPAGAKAKEVLAAIKEHSVGSVKLTTVYSRWLQ
jgi:Raf kinase inhibitor-like YbhB/YbcL family protein